MLVSLNNSDDIPLPNLKSVRLFVLSAFFIGSLITLCIAMAAGDKSPWAASAIFARPSLPMFWAGRDTRIRPGPFRCK